MRHTEILGIALIAGLQAQAVAQVTVDDYEARVYTDAAGPPDLFAALIAIAGAGDPSRAADIAILPVWAAQGELDDTVPVSGSRDMVSGLLAAGADPHYTELPGLGHAVWDLVFLDAG